MSARALCLAFLVYTCSALGGDKVLRVTFGAAETGFDPVRVSDYYSSSIISAVFDPLLTYDYLARPAKLVPNTAEALPQVSADGRTYTLHLRKGVYFQEDAA